MTEQMETPLTHRLIESPLGRLLYLPLVERFKLAAIGSEFTVLRARAIADVAGTSVERFCKDAGIAAATFTGVPVGVVGALVVGYLVTRTGGGTLEH